MKSALRMAVLALVLCWVLAPVSLGF